MSKTIIKIEDLSKQYRLGTIGTGTISNDLNRWWQTKILNKEDPYLKVGETNDRAHKGLSEYVWALKDINLEVKEGDVVGIIGKNGAGKSTLLKILSRVTAPTTGRIIVNGRLASLLEVGTGFHPELTGRENIFLNGAILGMTKAEIRSKLDEIIDFSGCERYIDTPVKRYSSGMNVRLGFAVAAFLEPEILIVDEVLAVGDAEFQKKAIGKMKDVSQNHGRTVLFVSHNMESIDKLCTKGTILQNGTIAFQGTQKESINYYLTNVNQSQSNILSKRTDRKGTGEIRFKLIEFKDENNNIVTELTTGQNINIVFSIDVIDKYATYLNNLNISFSIYDKNGKRILNLHNKLFHKSITINDLIKHPIVTLNIENLPVIHGDYYFNINIIQGYTYIDGFNDFFEIIIKEGNFNGKKIFKRSEDENIIINSNWILS